MDVSILVRQTTTDRDEYFGIVTSSLEQTPGGAIRLRPDPDGRIAEVVADFAISVVLTGELVVWLAAWHQRLRRARAPLVIVDASKAEVGIEVRDDVPELRGMLIVRTASGEETRIEASATEAEAFERIRRILGQGA